MTKAKKFKVNINLTRRWGIFFPFPDQSQSISFSCWQFYRHFAWLIVYLLRDRCDYYKSNIWEIAHPIAEEDKDSLTPITVPRETYQRTSSHIDSLQICKVNQKEKGTFSKIKKLDKKLAMWTFVRPKSYRNLQTSIIHFITYHISTSPYVNTVPISELSGLYPCTPHLMSWMNIHTHLCKPVNWGLCVLHIFWDPIQNWSVWCMTAPTASLFKESYHRFTHNRY